LTRGPLGSALVTPSEVCESAAPPTVVRDTVGAGDAFTAALLVGLLERRSLAEVSERANAVAAYVCSQPGATPPIPAALRS
jgi:fructokinase